MGHHLCIILNVVYLFRFEELTSSFLVHISGYLLLDVADTLPFVHAGHVAAQSLGSVLVLAAEFALVLLRPRLVLVFDEVRSTLFLGVFGALRRIFHHGGGGLLVLRRLNGRLPTLPQGKVG